MPRIKNTLLLLLAPTAFASIIDHPDPVPTISTACTVAGQPVACPPAPINIGTETVSATGKIRIEGLNTADGLTLDAWTWATSGSLFSPRDMTLLGSSALASISLDFFGSTDGPTRQGFATYTISTDGDREFGAHYQSSAFVQGLSGGKGTLVPFDLGVPFELGLFVQSAGGIGDWASASADADIRLQLFEADGTPVTIFDPPGPSVPEPRSLFLTLIGLVGIASIKRPLRSIPHRLYERVMDKLIGIDTLGYSRPPELESAEFHEYDPVPYRSARRLLESADVGPSDVFIEYGCGKGRIVVLATDYAYRKIVGIEISPELCHDAERNLAAKPRRCSAVEILCANATTYEVPDDATVLFFGNPFSGEIMRQVLAKVRASYLRRPRKITFLVYNQSRFIERNDAGSWIKPVYDELTSYPKASRCVFEATQ